MSPQLDPPHIVVSRLPLYLRCLTFMASDGQKVTSSKELAARLGISPAQIRKDLSHFGEFGKQGTGYDVVHLMEQLRSILHVDREWPVILIGAGDLGHALAHHSNLWERGFRIAAIFDNNQAKIGQLWHRLTIQDVQEMPQIIQENDFQIAILAIPAPEAQRLTDTMVLAGIKAILNYAPITINVPVDVRVEYMDPVIHLQRMTYYVQ
jgi:redox-sensing transcriptional repressor